MRAGSKATGSQTQKPKDVLGCSVKVRGLAMVIRMCVTFCRFPLSSSSPAPEDRAGTSVSGASAEKQSLLASQVLPSYESVAGAAAPLHTAHSE